MLSVRTSLENSVSELDINLAYVANVHIQRRYNQLDSLLDLAILLNVDSRALDEAYYRVFSRYVDQAIRHKRLKAAQRLLAESSLGIADIAAQVGWRDRQKFEMAFRDYVGLSPSAFRDLPYRTQVSALVEPD